MTSPRADITGSQDIRRLVDKFYERVKVDPLLAPIFSEVVHVDWSAHLPKMYAFWELLLFGAPGYKGNPLAIHQAVARLTPLTPREFGRWLALFDATVDDLFVGEKANEAKRRAARVAETLRQNVEAL